MTLCVQYGCGFRAPATWLNFDSSPTLRFERLPVLGRIYTKNEARFPAEVRYGDIVKGLPVAAGSVDKLYACHVLEHLAYEDAQCALANSYSLLKAGGIFRMVVPDLYSRAARYMARSGEPSAALDFLDSTLLGRRQKPLGLMGFFSATFGGANHLWMWDEASLGAALQRAGFVAIRRCTFGDSHDAQFAMVEQQDRFVDGDIVELAMECRKPNHSNSL